MHRFPLRAETIQQESKGRLEGREIERDEMERKRESERETEGGGSGPWPNKVK